MDKIKFYSLGSSKLSLLDLNCDLDTTKSVITSPNFNKAMTKVIKKDLNLLDNRILKIIKDINKKLTSNNINLTLNENYNSSCLDNINMEINDLINAIKIESKKNNTNLFSFHKRRKKKRKNDMEVLLELLGNYKNDFISMKNEFIKLDERRKALTDIKDEEIEVEEEDPLERTINFYINKKDLI